MKKKPRRNRLVTQAADFRRTINTVTPYIYQVLDDVMTWDVEHIIHSDITIGTRFLINDAVVEAVNLNNFVTIH